MTRVMCQTRKCLNNRDGVCQLKVLELGYEDECQVEVFTDESERKAREEKKK